MTLFLPLTLYSTLGYVTYQDIRSISTLKDQTVIAVKAPADTKLEVPDTAGVRLYVNQYSKCRSKFLVVNKGSLHS